MGRYEWIILEVGFVFLLVWELYRVRRDIRRAKEDDARKAATSNLKSDAAPGTAASPGPNPG